MKYSMYNPRYHARQHQGFTILELLVVVAIIGTIAALLLPALMAARETSRCMQCKNNLRDIGIATQQYHDSVKRFPEAWRTTPEKYTGYSWAIAILPYLEESDLARSIHTKLPIGAPQNEAARNTDLAIMRCPSDISDLSFDLQPEPAASVSTSSKTIATSNSSGASSGSSKPLARLPVANYQGVFGTLEADETFPAPSGDGTIVFNRTVRVADLQRGLSHTTIVGERPMAMVPSTWLGVDFRGEDAACRLVGSAITSPNCSHCDECEFGSRHWSGSNFAWADGHVTLIEESIDHTEYQLLSKRRMQ